MWPRSCGGGENGLRELGEVIAPVLVATLRGEKPTEKALRARAADFSEEKAANAYLALFEELLKARAP